jgi:4-oxalocrotonate tautomerase
MPYLNIKIAATESPETSAQVATLLTDLTASVLGKKRELTAVAIEYVKPSTWFIAGKNVTAPTFYLDIKVTEGTNTKNEKAAYVKQVFSGLSAILGNVAQASYIVIHEVRGDAWGYQAETQEFRYVQGRSL